MQSEPYIAVESEWNQSQNRVEMYHNIMIIIVA